MLTTPGVLSHPLQRAHEESTSMIGPCEVDRCREACRSKDALCDPERKQLSSSASAPSTSPLGPPRSETRFKDALFARLNALVDAVETAKDGEEQEMALNAFSQLKLGDRKTP